MRSAQNICEPNNYPSCFIIFFLKVHLFHKKDNSIYLTTKQICLKMDMTNDEDLKEVIKWISVINKKMFK